MIKKIILTALTLTLLASSAELAKPRFKGDGDFNKHLVVKAFENKTPDFILSKFNKKVNFHEKNEAGLPLWTFRKSANGKEHLAKYTWVIVDKRWILDGRMVWHFQADFSKPIGSKGPWRCWDAFYELLPKGVDWHKEQEKVNKEKF